MRIDRMTNKGVILGTERTVLIEWTKGDVTQLCHLHSVNEANGYIVGEAPWDMAKARSKLEKYQREHAEDGTGKYKVISKEDGHFIGRAGVSVYDRDADEFELGYVLKKAEWGKGLATEIAKAATARFFALNLSNKLIAFSDEHNTASHRVMQKIGMQFTERRNVGGSNAMVFEITKKEFQAKS